MKMRTEILFLSLLLIFLLIGCEQKSILDSSNVDDLKQKFAVVPQNEQNVMLDRMARVLAKEMVKPEMRRIVKQEVVKQFDGDYEVLMQRLISDESREYALFKRNLFDEYARVRQVEGAFSKVAAVNELEAFISKESLLQIAVPHYGDKWDTENEIPVVVYIPYGVDDEKVGVVKGYDANGNELYFSMDEDPGKPVVVIGWNERVGYNLMKPSFTVVAPPPIDEGGGGGGGGGYTPQERVNGGTEILSYIRTRDDGEAWLKGKAETYVVIAWQNGDYITKQLVDVDYDGKDYFPYLSLFNWYWATYGGEYYKLKFGEHDASGWPITVSYKGASISITLPDGDEDLGEDVVHKLDNYNEYYDTGNTMFRIIFTN